MKIIQSQTNNLAEWQYKELGELLDYEQPTNYIVDSEDYRDHYPTPVLTAGKTFILGYTDENFGVYQKLPVIIFDDFTTAHKFVDFPFKVKSSAMKILKAKKNVNIKFIYGWMQSHPYIVGEHKRNYLSEYQYQDVLFPSFSEQNRIVSVLETWDKAIEKLSKKIEVKKQIKKGLMQDLLTGKKRLEGFDDKWKFINLGETCKKITTGRLDANAMVKNGRYRFYTCAKDYYFIDEYAFDTEALLVSGNGANVGYVHYYKGKFNAYQRTYVLYDFHENILFVKYLLDLFLKNRIKEEVREGNTPYITMDTLTDMNLKIPSHQEQQSIVNILNIADREINILKRKLKVLKEQKRYLLNNLITGTIRTPETLSTKLIK